MGRPRITLVVLVSAAALAAAAFLPACSARQATSGGQGAEPQAGPSRRVGVAFSRDDALRDSVYAGLVRAVRERGGRLAEDVPSPAPGVPGLDLHCLSSKLGGGDDEQILRVLAEEGRDLVIATGPRFAPTIARVARNFPRVRFALIDAPRDFRDASPNATYLAFDEAQSAFLAGALAARLCSGARKPKLGFVGEADEPATRASQAGFLAGAGYVLPAFRRQGAVLAQYCGHAEGVAASVAETQASSQYKKGAVIIFNAAGAAGRGVYQAARKAGRLAIGSGGDLPGGEIVAAVYRRGDAAVGLLIEELFASGSVKAGTRLLGLKEGMVGCSVDEAAMDGAQPRLVELEAWRALIASGSLRVPFDDASEAEFFRSLD